MATRTYVEKETTYVRPRVNTYGEREKALYRGTQIVWYVFAAIEVILLLRFILRLLGANPGAAFTDLMYGLSGVFVAPFRLVFPTQAAIGSAIEWSTLLAMFMYWLVALGIVRLLTMGRSVTPIEAKEKLEEKDS